MISSRRRSVKGIHIGDKLGAIIFVSLLIASIFSGIVPIAAQAPTESVAVPDEYGAVMTAVNAAQAGDIDPSLDSDGDGISDYDEINGFPWENNTYFTNPYMASTDRDPYNDYMEITGINMPTTVTAPGRHPCVPSSPDLGIDLEGIDVTTLTTISSTKTKEQGSTWTLVTETGFSINPEVGIEGGPTFKKEPEVGITASGKISGEYHSKTTKTTSKWSREEWSSATAVDTGEAAKLKFHVKIRNTGTDAAKNVKLRFNVMIGEEGIVDTIWTDVVEWSITPGEVSEEMVISKDREGNDIVVSLDELKSIESGTPITITITEINAEVPWEGGWTTWNDYKGEIEPVSSKIIFDFGDGDVREYYVWSGVHLLAEPPHPYIHEITFTETIDRMVGVDDKEDGIYIGGVRMEKGWNFIFNNETAVEVEKKLDELDPDWNLYDLLNLTIEQGWTLLVKAPDTEPPVIHWASYSQDMKTIMASVSDNVQVKNVTAHIKVGNDYMDIKLEDDDGDLIFTCTPLTEPITDTYDDYVIADDRKFVSIWNDIGLAEEKDWWRMFRHDASHTGSSNSSSPDNDNLRWKYKIGTLANWGVDDNRHWLSHSPVVSDGKVFVFSADSRKVTKKHEPREGTIYLDFLLWDYKVNSFNEKDGKLEWFYPIEGYPIVHNWEPQILDVFRSENLYRLDSSPAVADGKIYIGSDNGILYCLNEKGDLEWKYNVPKFYNAWSPWSTCDVSLTSPSVADGKVFFQAFYSDSFFDWTLSYQNKGRGKIFCLDEDGNPLWSKWLDDGWKPWGGHFGLWGYIYYPEGSRFQIQSSPAVANGKVFVGSYGGKIYCYSASDGTLIWEYPASGNVGAVHSSPAVADGSVFVGSADNYIYCLDEITGNMIWKNETGGPVYSSPAVANGRVFVGSNDSRIYCKYAAINGTEIWNYTTGGSIYSSPAVANGKVFVGSNDRYIYCLDEITGTLIWKYKTGDWVTSSPVVVNGKVYVGSLDGYIYCFGPTSSMLPTASIISISPATAVQGEDTIVFKGNGTDIGSVVAYNWTSNIDGVINTSESFNISASDLSVGTHSIFFKVKDDEGFWSYQDVGYVTVKAPNKPPVGLFTSSPDAPFIDEAVTFNASNSYDPDGFIKRYTWDFGDGTTATGKVVTHAYPEAGDYNVTLNVTEYYGLTNETTLTFSVYYPLVQNLNTSESFATIQAAINDNGTQNGHTLLVVEPWTIRENVEVTKSLTIRSANGTATIVQAADANEHVFNVTVDNVTISGFTVSRATGISKAGIYLTTSEHCNLSSNTITNNYHGVFLTQSASNNHINFNNIVGNVEWGVYNDNIGETVDAESNWWGSASGPGGAGSGTGDNVSVNVDFVPWLGDESHTETVTDGTLDAKAETDTEVHVDGTATVTVAQYTANPEGKPPSGFSAAGDYIDVYVGDTSGVTQIEVRKYYTDAEITGLKESSLRLRYWNGAAWTECSDSGVNTAAMDGYSGYVWARITESTMPDLTYLEGGVFGTMGAPPSEGDGGGGGGGGGGTPLDSDGDGYLDIVERLMGTDLNDPCDPDTESRACVALIPTATPTPIALPAITPVPALVPTPTPTATPIGGEKEAEYPEEPGFGAIFALSTLLAVAYAVLRRNSRRLS